MRYTSDITLQRPWTAHSYGDRSVDEELTAINRRSILLGNFINAQHQRYPGSELVRKMPHWIPQTNHSPMTCKKICFRRKWSSWCLCSGCHSNSGRGNGCFRYSWCHSRVHLSSARSPCFGAFNSTLFPLPVITNSAAVKYKKNYLLCKVYCSI